MTSTGSEQRAHRSYDDAPAHVVEFYRENHREQTFEVASAKAAHFKALALREMSAWDALLELDELVDESDPDTELGQLDHALQTAEAARAASAPEWLIVTALIHDLGKVLCTFGEPMWAVVGDTFPVGCAFREEVVFHELFSENPDTHDERYSSVTGVYELGCGLDAVTMSWGHDEYLASVLADQLPEEALYVIRYHSFYAAHTHGAYRELFNERDHALMPWVRRFQAFDLYSKLPDAPERDALLPVYRELLQRWLPAPLAW
ncbi:MAG: inositol oxygenase [Planctomycetes bacterium]|nr:inositol oxygenase [Planctomycetota bacterium]